MERHDLERLLMEQVSYYRRRAPEYDATSLEGQAVPDRDEPWLAERDSAVQALDRFRPTGRVLELAAGTGQWTRHLVRWADTVTAVDASPEALAVNANRVTDPSVKRVAADVFRFEAKEAYDNVFFAFWLSHVPEELFDRFWLRVGRLLAPGGRAFLVDEKAPGGWTRARHRTEDLGPGTVVRRVTRGAEFRVVKVFHDPADLQARLAAIGWGFEIESPGRWLYYGGGARRMR